MTLRAAVRVGFLTAVGGLVIGTGSQVSLSASQVEDSPLASGVMVRGADSLAAAIGLALAPTFANPAAPRPTLLVVDASPDTAAAEDDFLLALLEADRGATVPGEFRIARLGRPPGRVAERPSQLASQLASVLERDSRVRDTVHGLRRTTSGYRQRGAHVVYLADRNVDDEAGLETLVTQLRERDQVFSVIGPQSGFERGRRDAFFRKRSVTHGVQGSTRAIYADDIGRDPLGGHDAKAPWRGGDTAYPHIPLYFTRPLPGEPLFRARFRGVRREALPTNTRRVPGAAPRPAREEFYSWVGSGFGPYSLMRLAGASGGNYVLWDVGEHYPDQAAYDSAALARIAPDLRSRRDIRADISRRPLARVLMRAWWQLFEGEFEIARITPPVKSDLRGSAPMLHPQVRSVLPFYFEVPRSHERFGERVEAQRRVLQDAVTMLDRALGAAPASLDGIDRRYRADAELLRYMLLVQDFELAAAVRGAAGVPSDAWQRPKLKPALRRKVWLPAGADPDAVKPRGPTSVDAQLATEVTVLRRTLLVRFAGTPHGEIVARNPVHEYTVELRTLEDLRTESVDEFRDEGAPSTPQGPTGPGKRGR